MKNFILSSLFFFLYLGVYAQTCPSGHLILTSQAAIDDFSISYPNCTNISSGMTIQGADITSLEGLSQITSFSGDLVIIECNALANLDGLEGINQSSFVAILANANLTSISGLSGIIPGSVPFFGIEENPQLSICNEPFLCDGLALGVPFLFAINNAPGCNSVDEINEACANPLLCPTGDLIISSQQDLDDFAATYPNCYQLLGSLIIENTDITNLDGLGQLGLIRDDLIINNADGLSSLSGLENLQTVSGILEIKANDLLADISGLNGLTAFSLEEIRILDNPLLATCNESIICSYLETGNPMMTVSNNAVGCQSFSEVVFACPNGSFCPQGNIAFTSQEEINNFVNDYPGCTAINGILNIIGGDINNLEPLSVINTVSGEIWIQSNPMLTTLNGIEHLVSNSSGLRINTNTALTDISALDGIEFPLNKQLSILNNTSLAICDYPNICDYFSNSNSVGSLFNNFGACNNEQSLTTQCTGEVLCPDADVIFTNQAEVDQFLTLYPNCTEISGHVTLAPATGIQNLHGLQQIQSISGNLYITKNNTITELGLVSLQSVGGKVKIEQTSLRDLSSLENLNEIGAYLKIAYNQDLQSLKGLDNLTIISRIKIDHNSQLNDLTALINLNNLDGYLTIRSNTALESLHGLGNIDPDGISQLNISDNTSLVLCNQNNICTYLATSKPRNIFNNSGDCETETDMQQGCTDNSCGNENLVLTTQQEVDDFSVNYPGCTVWSADLEITGTSITNLEGLQQLLAVQGNLNIHTTALNNLSNLENMMVVYGDLQIENNNNVTSLEGIPFINGNLMLTENDLLSNCAIERVCKYLSIGGAAEISNNAFGCESLSAVENNCDALVETCASINNSSDDAEEDAVGSISLTSSDLEMIMEDNLQKIGLRFVNLDIPAFAIIEKANIQFTVDQIDNVNPCALQIYGELNGNPSTFTKAPYNISNRTKTNTSITWTPEDWTVKNASGPKQKTIDISPILQEIVNTNGYTPGSSIVIIIEGSGKRTADSYDGNAEGAPALCVAYRENIEPIVEQAEQYNNDTSQGAGSVEVKVFPNPTTGLFQVVFPQATQGTYELRSLTGKLMLGNELGENTSIDLNHFPKGIYLLTLKTNNHHRTERIIKI